VGRDKDVVNPIAVDVSGSREEYLPYTTLVFRVSRRVE